MPMRSQCGNGLGVTNASTTPETNSTNTNPSATVISARPSLASASRRVRSPGTTQAQKIRNPAAAAMKIAVNSMNPCGRM